MRKLFRRGEKRATAEIENIGLFARRVALRQTWPPRAPSGEGLVAPVAEPKTRNQSGPGRAAASGSRGSRQASGRLSQFPDFNIDGHDEVKRAEVGRRFARYPMCKLSCCILISRRSIYRRRRRSPVTVDGRVVILGARHREKFAITV